MGLHADQSDSIYSSLTLRVVIKSREKSKLKSKLSKLFSKRIG